MQTESGVRGKWQSCGAAMKAQLRYHTLLLHPVAQAAVKLVLQKKNKLVPEFP